MGKLLDGIIFGVYIVISVFAIVLAIAGAILKPNTDDNGVPNDPELVEAPSESLQSPRFDGKFKYLANNGDIFEREVAKSNARTEPENILTGVRITYYCPCELCCGCYAGGATASGKLPQADHTAAANPDFLQLGTVVTIRGRDYIIEDTGPRYGTIDIFVNDHDEALKRGTQLTDIEVKRYGW